MEHIGESTSSDNEKNEFLRAQAIRGLKAFNEALERGDTSEYDHVPDKEEMNTELDNIAHSSHAPKREIKPKNSQNLGKKKIDETHPEFGGWTKRWEEKGE